METIFPTFLRSFLQLLLELESLQSFLFSVSFDLEKLLLRLSEVVFKNLIDQCDMRLFVNVLFPHMIKVALFYSDVKESRLFMGLVNEFLRA